MRRRRIIVESGGDAWGLREQKADTFSSGCTLLDCVLGGGWAYDRVANIIGDKSTGKTLLAIEACANFAHANKDGTIVYVEAEAAFDEGYAEALGLPPGRVTFPNNDADPKKHIQTIEDLFEDLERRCSTTSKKRLLYIVDSMDALSDRDEVGREIDKASYGQSKPKKISELFRRLIAKFKKRNLTLLIISQVRDAIGVAFGDKLKRSGGRALDFYASHALWLHHMGQMKVVRKKVERVVGVRVRAHCKKNKLGPPFRECEFPLLFGFGVEDVVAGLDWLVEVGKWSLVGMTKEGAEKAAGSVAKLTNSEYRALRDKVQRAVRKGWAEVEKEFEVTRRKYQ